MAQEDRGKGFIERGYVKGGKVRYTIGGQERND